MPALTFETIPPIVIQIVIPSLLLFLIYFFLNTNEKQPEKS